MNPKNTTFIQRHVEKIVLAVAAAVTLLVLIYFFVLSPFVVEVNRKQVGPDKAIEMVKSEANQLRRSFNDSAIPAEKTKVPDWSSWFTSRYEQPPVDQLTLGGPFSYPGLAADVINKVGRIDRLPTYHLPGAPLVQDFKVRTGHVVYGDAGDEQINKAIYAMIGDQTPRDFRYASVSGELNLTTWEKTLADVPHGEQPIPVRLRSNVFVAGLFLQRQTLDPATGEWTDTTVVPSLPGQIAFGRPDAPQIDYTEQLALSHVMLVRSNQLVIVQPPFVETAGGLPWTPPFAPDMKLNREDQARLAELQQSIDKLNGQIRVQERQLGIETQQPNQPSRMPEPGMPEMPTGREPATARDNNNNRSAAIRERAEEDRRKRRERYDELVRQRDDLIAQKNALLGIETRGGINTSQPGMPEMDFGGDINDPGHYMPPPQPYPQPQYPQPGMPPRGNSMPTQPGEEGKAEPQPDKVVDVWAHDLTVEPGKTYRYRMVATMLNPLFRVGGINPDQMAANLNRIAVGPDEAAFEASPWSDPVSIDPAYYYFLVSATGNGAVGRFSVWTVYDGKWRNAIFEESAGDPVGGAARVPTSVGNSLVDMHINRYLVDLVVEGAANARAMLANPANGDLSSVKQIDPSSNELLQRLQAEMEVEEAYLGGASNQP